MSGVTTHPGAASLHLRGVPGVGLAAVNHKAAIIVSDGTLLQRPLGTCRHTHAADFKCLSLTAIHIHRLEHAEGNRRALSLHACWTCLQSRLGL